MLITLYWHDLEGAREKTLLTHAPSPSQTTTGAADLIVMLGSGEDLEWSTNLSSGYRLHLRAEAV